jgi:hypothetical protein
VENIDPSGTVRKPEIASLRTPELKLYVIERFDEQFVVIAPHITGAGDLLGVTNMQDARIREIPFEEGVVTGRLMCPACSARYEEGVE